MSQCSASPIRIADSTAASFSTGSEPGSPRHTGHTWVLGSAPNVVAQPQNILVAVDSSTCTSRPSTGSKRAMTSSYSSKSGPAATLMPSILTRIYRPPISTRVAVARPPPEVLLDTFAGEHVAQHGRHLQVAEPALLAQSIQPDLC